MRNSVIINKLLNVTTPALISCMLGRVHSLDLSQCIGDLEKFLSSGLNQGFVDLIYPPPPPPPTPAVKGEVVKIMENHGILSLRKSGNPNFICDQF